MYYLSPASLPGSPAAGLADKKALLLLQRKLMAELELSADGYLHIKNRAFSKSDILAYFDSLKDETVLHYHTAISRDTILVGFLEEGQLSGEGVFAEASLYDEPHFLQWISAYFYTALIGYVTKCLQENDEDGLHILMQNPLLLTVYDRERAWLQVIQLLENNISMLDHYREEADENDAVLPTDDVAPLIDDHYIRMITLFPEDAFAGVRDKYAIALVQISICAFNKPTKERDIALGWMGKARLLAVSEEVAASVTDKIREMEKIRNRAQAYFVRVMVVLGIIILKMMFVDHSTHDEPTITRVTYINGKDSILIHNVKQLDSLMHKK